MHISKKALASIILSVLIILGAYKYYGSQYRLEKKREAAARLTVTTPPTLLGEQWIWQHTALPGGERLTPESDSFILTLSKENNSVTSTTDCNTISSTYITNGEVLSFAPFTATEMSCKKSQESDYTAELSLATSYTITDNTLVINLNRDSGTMFFAKAAKGTSSQGKVSLAPGETKELRGVTLTVTNITEDSRCPANAQCIQKGTVTAAITLKKGTTIETRDVKEGDNAFVFEGETISLVKVLPEKISTQKIQQKDYILTFQIGSK